MIMSEAGMLVSLPSSPRHYLQLPQGAMPLDGSVGTISQGIKLPAYLSTQLQQTFYFPHPGTYQQAPVSVATVTGRYVRCNRGLSARLYIFSTFFPVRVSLYFTTKALLSGITVTGR